MCARECGGNKRKSAGSGRVKTERKRQELICADVFFFSVMDFPVFCGGKIFIILISRPSRRKRDQQTIKEARSPESRLFIKKKKKDIPHTKLFSPTILRYSRSAHKARTNERFFFLLISHSSPTRPPSVCLCERERGFLDTWSTKARALEEYTKRLYLNKNLEKKAKAD